MKLKCIAFAAAAASVLAVSAEVKIGIIGLDTSHSTHFTRIINVEKPPEVAGLRVVAAYPWGSRDIVSSTNRIPMYTEYVKTNGVKVVDSIDELIAMSDFICLETNDGREHLWQAEKVFKAGKPAFIDKPLAHNLKDALAIYELGKKYNAKYFSASSLRYGEVVKAARRGDYGKVRTACITSPAPEEKQGTHNYYSWYGIHGFEPFVAVMGTGAKRVSCLRTEKGDAIGVEYPDGRVGQLNLLRDMWHYSGYVVALDENGKGRVAAYEDGAAGYKPLLADILNFIKSGKPPFPPEETIEIFMLMEAAEMSAKRGGVPVTLAEAAQSCASTEMDAIYTVPHELDGLLKSGHIQGACCSEQGIYLSHALGIDKIGWDGKLLKHIDAPGHLGDSAYAGGRIYGAFVIRDPKARKDGKQGLVRVWDENLNQVAEAWFDEALDGIAVLGDTVYVGVDRWGHSPHDLCCIKRLGLDLSDKGNVDIDIGYRIHYGVQTMATDGKSLYLGNYGAGRDAGNPEGYCCTRLSPDLKVLGNIKFGCSEGFGLVPRSVSKRDTPVFFRVCAMGGNMQGWRKDPVNNPPRIRIEFYECRDGKFSSATRQSSLSVRK